jgi:ATP-dependent Clp protease adaptor protein ClpS
MHQTEESAPEMESPPIRVRVEPKPRPVAKPKHQPLYAVILHNDPINRFEWVIGVLVRILRCGRVRAFWMTLKTHVTGRCVIWSGSLEVAELKAGQVRSVGPDPSKINYGASPLSVSVEALA